MGPFSVALRGAKIGIFGFAVYYRRSSARISGQFAEWPAKDLPQ